MSYVPPIDLDFALSQRAREALGLGKILGETIGGQATNLAIVRLGQNPIMVLKTENAHN